MENTATWKLFEVSGRIEDYLNFKLEDSLQEENLYDEALQESEEEKWEMRLR